MPVSGRDTRSLIELVGWGCRSSNAARPSVVLSERWKSQIPGVMLVRTAELGTQSSHPSISIQRSASPSSRTHPSVAVPRTISPGIIPVRRSASSSEENGGTTVQGGSSLATMGAVVLGFDLIATLALCTTLYSGFRRGGASLIVDARAARKKTEYKTAPRNSRDGGTRETAAARARGGTPEIFLPPRTLHT